MVNKTLNIMDKSRRDNTLLTVGFNLRKESSIHKVLQGRNFDADKSIQKLVSMFNFNK